MAEHLQLTAAQQGVWLGQQLNPGSALYNAAECIEIHGSLDVALFETALRQAVMEAEALNARFVASGNGVLQLIEPIKDWPLPIIDVGGAADPRMTAEEWMREDLRKVVDLTRGPLFAHALFVAKDARYYWYQRAHHIALDGYGFALVAQRAARIYTSLATGRASGAWFGELRKVVEDDLAYRHSERQKRDREFWLGYFDDRPDVASLGNQTSVSCGRLLRHGGQLPGDALQGLQALADRVDATWVEAVLAVIALYVHRRTGVAEVVLGVPVMGRVGSIAARVPAMVMNVAPLRIDVGPSPALASVIRTVANELRKTRPHQRYPAAHLRRELKLVGGGRRLYGPLVNIMPFDYQLDFAGSRGLARNVSAGGEFIEDIAIHFHVRADGEPPTLEIDANPNCYSMAEVATHFHNILDLLAHWKNTNS